MDDLQYFTKRTAGEFNSEGFKPYYKWMTFNTYKSSVIIFINRDFKSFKPYYKWMTFNTYW